MNTIDLKPILQKYPDVVNNNKGKLKNILRDIYPEMSREVNILIEVLESGIALQMRQLNYIEKKDIKNYLSILEKLYGTSSIYGLEAIYSWADGVGILYDSIESPDNKLSTENPIVMKDNIFDINSLVYKDKNVEMTYLGIEIVGGDNPYRLSIKFIAQNKTDEKITFYDEIVVVNGIGFSINTFAYSQAGYKKIIGFSVDLEKCKYCGVQAVKDIHDLALKLRYVINDKDYYTDEMKLKLVFI